MLRKIILICIMLSSVIAINAKKDSSYDWTRVINAIAEVESEGKPKVKNSAGCVGLLQITKIGVRQCSMWLKQEKSKKRYTYNDRLDPEKSKEMFILTQKHLNPKNDIEHAIRIWNGRRNYKKRKTDGYYKKVMKIYNKAGK